MDNKPSNVVGIDPYTEGKKAFSRGIHWNANPYAHMALSYHSYMWTCGWDDASLGEPTGDRDHVYLQRSPVY